MPLWVWIPFAVAVFYVAAMSVFVLWADSSIPGGVLGLLDDRRAARDMRRRYRAEVEAGRV
jgi:hypothetical protein